MTVTISLTLAKQVEFFNEYVRSKIYREIITAANIVDKTNGKKLKSTNGELDFDLDKESKDKILPGGRQILFLLHFPVSDLTSFVIKPYNLRLRDIACHYASVEELNSVYRNLKIPFEQKQLKIMVSDVFALGTFTLGQTEIPFVIQRYCEGTKLTDLVKEEHSLVHSFLPMIFKHLAKEGFIIDPYPQNWYVHGSSLDMRSIENETLEYIDLAYFHSLQTNVEIKRLLKSLKPINL